MQKLFAAFLITLALLPCQLKADMTGMYVTPSQFIGDRTLVSFWRADCEPCAKQLPILIGLARLNPELHIKLVVLKGRQGDQTIPYALPANLVLHDVSDELTSLRAFGATQSMLPFSAFLHEDGSVCRSHAGIQGTRTFESWAKEC